MQATSEGARLAKGHTAFTRKRRIMHEPRASRSDRGLMMENDTQTRAERVAQEHALPHIATLALDDEYHAGFLAGVAAARTLELELHGRAEADSIARAEGKS